MRRFSPRNLSAEIFTEEPSLRILHCRSLTAELQRGNFPSRLPYLLHSLRPESPCRSFSRDASCGTSREALYSESDEIEHFLSPSTPKDPPPPFTTLPKIKPIELVMRDNPGKDIAALRTLTTALAREAIFGRDELALKSLSGTKNRKYWTKKSCPTLIKTLVHSRVPEKSKTEFEGVWSMCRSSLSKSCQTLRQSQEEVVP